MVKRSIKVKLGKFYQWFFDPTEEFDTHGHLLLGTIMFLSPVWAWLSWCLFSWVLESLNPSAFGLLAVLVSLIFACLVTFAAGAIYYNFAKIRIENFFDGDWFNKRF